MNNPINIKKNVLFLCTGNSCRSQMAEGWARHLFPEQIQAYSAGIETHGLNQHAVAIMAEAGVDISGHTSKHLDTLRSIPMDLVVTVCAAAHQSCPYFPGHCRVIAAGFDDPPQLAKQLAAHGASAEQQLDAYRNVRDQIKAFIETLPELFDPQAQQ